MSTPPAERRGRLASGAIAAVEDATSVYRKRSVELSLGLGALFPVADLIYDLAVGLPPQWLGYGLTFLCLFLLLAWLRRRPYTRAEALVLMAVLGLAYASSIFLPRAHDGYIVIFFVFTPLAYLLLGAWGGLLASLLFTLLASALAVAAALGLSTVELGPYRLSQILMADLALAFQNVYCFAGERRHRRSLLLLIERNYFDEATGMPNERALRFEGLGEGESLLLADIVNFRDLASLGAELEGPLDLGGSLAAFLDRWGADLPGLRLGPYRLGEGEFAFVLDASCERAGAAASLEEGLSGPGLIAGTPLRFAPRIVCRRFNRPVEGPRALETALADLVECATLGRRILHRGGEEEGGLSRKAALLIRNIEGARLGAVFQPVYDCLKGGTAFLEALIRLEEGGRMVSPEAYVDAATRLGLIGRLSDYMLEAALDLARASGHSVSFNVDFGDLERRAFRRRLLAALSELGGRASLIVELTEHSAYVDAEEVSGFCRELHEAGGLVFLDDFGSGYSNYASLLELRVDAVKAAGDIVREIGQRREAATLYRGMTSFCAAAGIEVVAEHVSDERIYELAREGGARFLQGYFLSRPLEARAIAEGAISLPRGLSPLPTPLRPAG